MKYLGVLLDSQLTFKAHITSVSKKISRVTGMMNRIHNFVNEQTLRMLYYSLVYPFILYGIPIWGNADVTIINPIYITQKKVVRIIKDKNNFIGDSYVKEHSAPLFKDLELLTVFDVFKTETLKFVYQSLKKLNPSQFHSFYSYPTTSHDTAAMRNHDLNTPSVRTTTYGLKSLKYIGTLLWNSISNSLQNAPSKMCFARLVKKSFCDHY